MYHYDNVSGVVHIAMTIMPETVLVVLYFFFSISSRWSDVFIDRCGGIVLYIVLATHLL